MYLTSSRRISDPIGIASIIPRRKKKTPRTHGNNRKKRWGPAEIPTGTHGKRRGQKEPTEIPYNPDGLPQFPAGNRPLSSAASIGLRRSLAGISMVVRGRYRCLSRPPWPSAESHGHPLGSPRAPTSFRCISWSLTGILTGPRRDSCGIPR